MADHRTKRQKLEAMANQSASPAEAAIARMKLAKMDGKVPDDLKDILSSLRFDDYWSWETKTTSGSATLTWRDIVRAMEDLDRPVGRKSTPKYQYIYADDDLAGPPPRKAGRSPFPWEE